ncbi:hypothetical protein [Tropicimonas sp. S265A]|uniref:hypothetical protein n=1 Tax=Tropicimonas sp. S265A TaxID=3415134 RepID=UPI003C7E988A
MIRRLSTQEAVLKLTEGASEGERVEIGQMLLLSTKLHEAVKPLRQTLPVIERHAGDIEDAHYRHLETVHRSRNPKNPTSYPDEAPSARATPPEGTAESGLASGAFSSRSPAVVPLTDHHPDGEPATRGTILPSGTSSRRTSLWSRFLTWSNRVDRSWTGSVFAAVFFFGGWAALFIISGVLQ